MRIDYYPLVSRAVRSLKSDTGEDRRALFERIRVILSDQLRTRQPPASKSEIEREHAALEIAIRRVELESASRFTISRLQQKILLPGLKDTLQYLCVFIERARTELADRIQHLLGRLARFPAAMYGAIEDVKLPIEFALSNMLPSLRPASSLKPKTPVNRLPGKSAFFLEGDALSGEPTSIGGPIFLENLFGMQLLDKLMRDAARPFPPDSAPQDARTVLRWLGLENPQEITAEHYNKFAFAVHYHALENQEQPARPSPATFCSSPALNDDIRSVLNRLLEREQTERILDDALTWFARVWIGLFVFLNFLAVVICQVAAPTVGSGLAKVLEIYSPMNVWMWIVQVGALSPGLLAIAWRNRRLRPSAANLQDAIGATTATTSPKGWSFSSLSASVMSGEAQS